MVEPSRIYIDSADRQSYQSQNDFTIGLGNNQTLEDVGTIQLDSLIFPNSLYSINSNNNIFYVSMRRYSSVAPTTYVEQICTVQIPSGHYTPSDIISLLPTEIENCFAQQHPTLPAFTVQSMTYSEVQKRFYIDIQPQTYGRASSTLPGGDDIDWFIVLDENYTGYPNTFKNTLNYVLGFERQTQFHPTNITAYIDSPLSFQEVSQVLNRLSGISYVYLHCDLVNSAISSQQNGNANSVLGKISLPNEYGDILFSHFGGSNDVIRVAKSKFDTIRFWVTDSSFQLVDLNGSDYSFSLLLNYYN